MNKNLTEIGVVAIGRNEGKRLDRCLKSIPPETAAIVYVDSGSTDGSVALARSHGAQVVELDPSIPFCAARARNAGYERLMASSPAPNYIQFIDADCEIIENWLSLAADCLMKAPDLAIVAGWLKERSPEASIYNRLGDLEWNAVGAGAVDAVGGIFMIRREAFDSVGGFDSSVAAGEEPELCQRLSRRGWRLVRIDQDMALHDLAMMRFGQWWRRMVRNGYGSLDVATRFGIAKFRNTNRRARLWTAWLSMTLILTGVAAFNMPESPGVMGLALFSFGLWPARWLRITLRTWKNGQPLGTAMAYAYFMVISFLPQFSGQFLYWTDRWFNQPFRLVEYKAPPPSAGKEDHES